MPIIFNKQGEFEANNASKGKPVNNPDGIYSGMTAGLAREDGSHCTVTNMPGDTRKIGPLPDKNQEFRDEL
jgi:hypothetical protein